MGNQSTMQGNVARRALFGLAAVGALVAVSAPASAACTTAYVCTWDTNADSRPDVLYAGAAGTSAVVTSQPTYQNAVIQAPFTTVQGTAWYVDEDGDGDPERLYVGGSSGTLVAGHTAGGYASVYMVDRDQGDVMDYTNAVVQGGVDSVIVGYSFEYRDTATDLKPGSPYQRTSAL